MKKASLYFMILTIIVKIIAYFKDFVFAYVYGTSQIVDVFVVATSIPTLVFSFIGSAIAAGYIPRYNEISKSKNEEAAKKFSSNLMNILLVLFLLITIVIFIFTKQVVLLFASGFTGEILEKTIFFTRIASLTLLLSVPSAIIGSYLQLKESFWAVAIQTIPTNIILIVFIFVSKTQDNTNVLIYGFLIGAILQVVILIPSAIKHKYKHKRIFDIKDENIKKFVLLLAPIFLAIAVNDINQIVDKTLASKLPIGSISAISYSQKIDGMIRTLIITPITIVMFPEFSRIANNKNYNELSNKTIETLVLISILIIPATISMIFYSEEITRLLYGRGEFGEESIRITSNALLFYSIGILGFGFRQTLTRVYYSLNNFKTPLYNSMLSACINITLNFIFFYFTDMGLNGLALATSISGLTSALYLFLKLKLEHDSLNIKRYFSSFIQIILASSIMILFGLLINNYILHNTGLSQNVSFIIIIFSSIIIYAIIIMFTRIDEIKSIKNNIKNKIFYGGNENE